MGENFNILHPHYEWIEDRCYRKFPIRGSEACAPCIEEESSIEIKKFSCDDDEECDLDIPIKHDGNRFFVSIPIPAALVGYVAGKSHKNRVAIEEQTNTLIMLPSRHTDVEVNEREIKHQRGRKGPQREAKFKPPNTQIDGEVVINGITKKSISAAYHRVLGLMTSGRLRTQPTHFISFPVNSDKIQKGYRTFMEDVLSHCSKERGIDETLFQPMKKLHLTICMLVLLDKRDKEQATEVLQKSKDKIVSLMNNNPLRIKMQGIEYMNDDPAEVDVLYGKVEEVNQSNRLQLIANTLAEEFCNSGLSVKQNDSVKLHVTLMKSKSVGEERQSFDARKILKKYENHAFGEMILSQIHISVRFSQGTDGYYLSNYYIKI